MSIDNIWYKALANMPVKDTATKANTFYGYINKIDALAECLNVPLPILKRFLTTGEVVDQPFVYSPDRLRKLAGPGGNTIALMILAEKGKLSDYCLNTKIKNETPLSFNIGSNWLRWAQMSVINDRLES